MSRTWHIYGVGNALVDVEVEVTPDQLSALEIEKGVMTLIDAERQTYLMEHLQGQVHKRTGGGSAANTIMGAAYLGAQCFYSCKVADDDTGDFFAVDLKEAGVGTNLAALRDVGTTGTCLVMVTPDADRTMNTCLGISADISPDQLVEEELRESAFLYIEGYLVSTPNSLDTALKARAVAAANDVKTAFTFSDPAMVQYCAEGLERVLGDGVDVLFCNESEATQFTGRDDPREAAAVLAERSGVLAVTLGPKGSLLHTDGQWLEIPAEPVKAVDSNGAGDLYAGAFMYALSHGHELEACGRLASRAASTLVTRFGARLDVDTLRDLRAEVLGA